MMSEDRLPDEFWTENELYKMMLGKLVLPKYYEEPTHIAVYHLYKNGVNTGLVMILAVEYLIDAQEAIDKLWKPAGIVSILGKYSDKPSVLNQIRCEALYMVLDKYKYSGKTELPGSDKVYRYESWMDNLIDLC